MFAAALLSASDALGHALRLLGVRLLSGVARLAYSRARRTGRTRGWPVAPIRAVAGVCLARVMDDAMGEPTPLCYNASSVSALSSIDLLHDPLHRGWRLPLAAEEDTVWSGIVPCAQTRSS